MWQRLLERADAERPDRLGQLNGAGEVHPLVGIDHHLDLRADGLADARSLSMSRGDSAYPTLIFTAEAART